MKQFTKLAIAAVVSLSAISPATSFAADAPAKKEAPEKKEKGEAEKVELTGTVIKEGEKFKFKTTDGKTYMITKNNFEKIKPMVGKNVKIKGKAKTKMSKKDKPFHMLVAVRIIEEVKAAAE